MSENPKPLLNFVMLVMAIPSLFFFHTAQRGQLPTLPTRARALASQSVVRS